MNMDERNAAYSILREGSRSRAERTIDTRVRELRQREPKLTKEAAYAKVLQTSPELYDAYNGRKVFAAPVVPPAISSGRLETWSDVERAAKERANRNGTTYEAEIAWLIRNDRDAARIAGLKSQGLI